MCSRKELIGRVSLLKKRRQPACNQQKTSPEAEITLRSDHGGVGKN